MAHSRIGPLLAVSCTVIACGAPAGAQEYGVDSTAARIEIDALRTAALDTTSASNERYVMDGSMSAVSMRAAMLALSLETKPLRCRAESQRQVLRVHCVHVAPAPTESAPTDSSSNAEPGPVDYLADVLPSRRRGSESDGILVVGRDTLLASVGSIERWVHQYAMGWTHPGLDLGARSLNAPLPESQLALRSGCVAIVDLAADQSANDTLPALRTADQTRATDEQLIALAAAALRSHLLITADDSADATPRQGLAELVAVVRERWAGRVTPPVIVEFEKRYSEP